MTDGVDRLINVGVSREDLRRLLSAYANTQRELAALERIRNGQFDSASEQLSYLLCGEGLAQKALNSASAHFNDSLRHIGEQLHSMGLHNGHPKIRYYSTESSDGPYRAQPASDTVAAVEEHEVGRAAGRLAAAHADLEAAMAEFERLERDRAPAADACAQVLIGWRLRGRSELSKPMDRARVAYKEVGEAFAQHLAQSGML